LDNVAAINTTDFDAWWGKLPQSTRKNCRRAERRGLSTRFVSLDRSLAEGIKRIYDETPIRQGRRFWHYGKAVETVLSENSSYPDRSEFVGAYHEHELVGFMKVVYVGRLAWIMQFLSLNAHADKRPMNAIIAKAVEVCHQRGMTHLIYSKFQYGNHASSPLIEFKVRNGFERLDFPRYYVPLTLMGRVGLRLRLHRGAIGLLPPRAVAGAMRVRERLNALLSSDSRVGAETASALVQD
jgi:hypothetical protein